MSPSIITNTIVASLGRVLNIAAGILVTALTVRLLEPSSYGQYVFLLSLGTILQLAADFGLYLTLTADVGRYPHQLKELFSHVVSLRLILLVIVFGFGLVGLAIFPAYRPLLPAFCVITLGLIAQSISQLCMGIFQARSVVWQATVGDLWGRAVQVLVLFIVIALPSSYHRLTTISLAFTVGLIVSLLVHQKFISRITSLTSHVSRSQWWRLLQKSWPLGAMLVVNAVYFRIDTVMLSWLRSSAEVGYYGLAYKIMESLLFFPAMLGGILLPAFSRQLKASVDDAAGLLHQALQFVLFFAALTTLLLAAYPHLFIYVLTFSEFSLYAASVPLLAILGIATGTIFIGNIIGFALVAAGRQKQLLILYSLLAVGNIVGNALLIPYYGAPAAAWTTVVTEFAALTAAACLLHRVLPLTPLLPLLPRLVVAVLPPLLFIILTSSTTPWIGLPVTILVYVLSAYATGLWHLKSFLLLRQSA